MFDAKLDQLFYICYFLLVFSAFLDKPTRYRTFTLRQKRVKKHPNSFGIPRIDQNVTICLSHSFIMTHVAKPRAPAEQQAHPPPKAK